MLLLVMFAKVASRADYDSLSNTYEQERLLKAICYYDNPSISSKRALDIDYFVYYLEQIEEDARYSYPPLADQMNELLQLVEAYRAGKLSRIRWHESE